MAMGRVQSSGVPHGVYQAQHTNQCESPSSYNCNVFSEDTKGVDYLHQPSNYLLVRKDTALLNN
jgi:hypothetical protein